MKKTLLLLTLSLLMASNAHAKDCADLKIFDKDLKIKRMVTKICVGESYKLTEAGVYTVSNGKSQSASLDTTAKVMIKLVSVNPVIKIEVE